MGVSANPGKTVFLRRSPDSPEGTRMVVPDAIGLLPEKESRLRCTCGSVHFFVTRIDFVCVACSRSYKD